MLYSILKNKNDIDKVFASTRILSEKKLHIKICPNFVGCTRIVFAISKKQAHKPMRNKQIRRMRVITSTIDKYIQGCDIAIIICAVYASFDELKASYEMLMLRAKQLRSGLNV